MSFCAGCGSLHAAEARFCGNCGLPVTQSPVPPVPAPAAARKAGASPAIELGNAKPASNYADPMVGSQAPLAQSDSEQVKAAWRWLRKHPLILIGILALVLAIGVAGVNSQSGSQASTALAVYRQRALTKCGLDSLVDISQSRVTGRKEDGDYIITQQLADESVEFYLAPPDSESPRWALIVSDPRLYSLLGSSEGCLGEGD